MTFSLVGSRARTVIRRAPSDENRGASRYVEDARLPCKPQYPGRREERRAHGKFNPTVERQRNHLHDAHREVRQQRQRQMDGGQRVGQLCSDPRHPE